MNQDESQIMEAMKAAMVQQPKSNFQVTNPNVPSTQSSNKSSNQSQSQPLIVKDTFTSAITNDTQSILDFTIEEANAWCGKSSILTLESKNIKNHVKAILSLIYDIIMLRPEQRTIENMTNHDDIKKLGPLEYDQWQAVWAYLRALGYKVDVRSVGATFENKFNVSVKWEVVQGQNGKH